MDLFFFPFYLLFTHNWFYKTIHYYHYIEPLLININTFVYYPSLVSDPRLNRRRDDDRGRDRYRERERDFRERRQDDWDRAQPSRIVARSAHVDASPAAPTTHHNRSLCLYRTSQYMGI